MNVSECARLYGKHRKWVYDQIKRYDLETQKEGNRTRLRLVDLIAHKGELQGNGTTLAATPTEQSQKVAPEVAQEAELLRQENRFLHERLGNWRQIVRNGVGGRNGYRGLLIGRHWRCRSQGRNGGCFRDYLRCSGCKWVGSLARKLKSDVRY